MRKIASVLSSFPYLPNASSVGSLNLATLPICVMSVVCISNMSNFHAFLSLCFTVFACKLVHINSPTTCTHSFACFAGALTEQFSDSFVEKHLQRACLILTPSTPVFHNIHVFDDVVQSFLVSLALHSFQKNLEVSSVTFHLVGRLCFLFCF